MTPESSLNQIDDAHSPSAEGRLKLDGRVCHVAGVLAVNLIADGVEEG